MVYKVVYHCLGAQREDVLGVLGDEKLHRAVLERAYIARQMVEPDEHRTAFAPLLFKIFGNEMHARVERYDVSHVRMSHEGARCGCTPGRKDVCRDV